MRSQEWLRYQSPGAKAWATAQRGLRRSV